MDPFHLSDRNSTDVGSAESVPVGRSLCTDVREGTKGRRSTEVDVRKEDTPKVIQGEVRV